MLAFGATAANAALTVGAAGSNDANGTATGLVTGPSAIEFDTTNPTNGAYQSYFQFNNDGFNAAVFSVTASSVPITGTTVSLIQLFTGGSIVAGVYSGGSLVNSIPGSSNSLTLSTALVPNTNYTLVYSGTLGANTTPGNISGNGAFAVTVPEPATWALMLLGFGGMGMAMRRRRRTTAFAQIA
jgi:uncharacterized protein YfaP (DUF2135 family)